MTGQTASAFEKYIAELVVAVRALPEVIGLVLLGSTADRARVDQWSDHDFAVIVEPGAAAHLLGDPSWLPEPTNIAMVMPDSPDGRRVMYSDGRMLEYAITDLAGLATWFTNEYEVVLDRGGVAQAWADVAARPKPSDNVDPADEIRSFLSVLYFGVAMARRGELIVAGAQVRTWSLAYLLRAWPHRVAAEGASRLDSLNEFRRFDFVFPEVAARIGAALEQDVESAARSLLEIAETSLAPGWEGWPTEAVAAIRTRLGWPG